MKLSEKTKMHLSFAFLGVVIIMGVLLRYFDVPMKGLPALLGIE